MKTQCHFLAIILGFLALPAKAEVTIWNWAYVIDGADELLSGSGSSIFQIDHKTHTGPLHSRDNGKFRLKLSIDGENVSAALSPEAKGETIQLSGLLSFEPIQGGNDCRAIIKLSNGISYVALRRLAKSCKP